MRIPECMGTSRGWIICIYVIPFLIYVASLTNFEAVWRYDPGTRPRLWRAAGYHHHADVAAVKGHISNHVAHGWDTFAAHHARHGHGPRWESQPRSTPDSPLLNDPVPGIKGASCLKTKAWEATRFFGTKTRSKYDQQLTAGRLFDRPGTQDPRADLYTMMGSQDFRDIDAERKFMLCQRVLKGIYKRSMSAFAARLDKRSRDSNIAKECARLLAKTKHSDNTIRASSVYVQQPTWGDRKKFPRSRDKYIPVNKVDGFLD